MISSGPPWPRRFRYSFRFGAKASGTERSVMFASGRRKTKSTTTLLSTPRPRRAAADTTSRLKRS